MEDRLFFPATKRNRNAIRATLEEYLPNKGVILELASGSGEHGVFFQKLFPRIIWQCSDLEESCINSINAWIKYQKLNAIMPSAINLDVAKTPWDLRKYNLHDLAAIVCINLIHISRWNCTISIFEQSKDYLPKDSPLIIYGPFMMNGHHTSTSNFMFDRELKSINKNWGLRNLEDIQDLARKNSFEDSVVIQMPSNNLSIVFKKS